MLYYVMFDYAWGCLLITFTSFHTTGSILTWKPYGYSMLPAGFKIVDNNMGILRLCFFFIEASENNNKLSKLS